MNRISAVLAACLILVLSAVPPLASAAAPKRSLLVSGVLYKSGTTAIPKPVDLKVAATGKTARFTWWCGQLKTITNRSSITVAIKPDGSFAGASNVGSVTVWTVKGRFLTTTSARASLRLISICDARGGLVTLKSP